MAESGGQIDTVMHESRVFPPPAEFVASASIGSPEAYQALWDAAYANPEEFWGKFASEELHWFEPYKAVLEWNE
ncbi:MAG: acetyl-coenzyme A synthetase, partial [Planctomycetales bacterium]|nr:acetyl-coenzyme A synthetase [Planctomycetales bacterium]